MAGGPFLVPPLQFSRGPGDVPVQYGRGVPGEGTPRTALASGSDSTSSPDMIDLGLRPRSHMSYYMSDTVSQVSGPK